MKPRDLQVRSLTTLDFLKVNSTNDKLSDAEFRQLVTSTLRDLQSDYVAVARCHLNIKWDIVPNTIYQLDTLINR